MVVQQNAAAGELDVLMQEVQARAQAAGDTREEVRGASRMVSLRMLSYLHAADQHDCMPCTRVVSHGWCCLILSRYAPLGRQQVAPMCLLFTMAVDFHNMQ